MSFPQYSAYKDSGVEWLEEVPEHWQSIPFKYIADFVNGMAFKPEQWSEVGVPIIRIENLNNGEDFNFYVGQVASRYHVNTGELLFGWSGNRGTSFGPFLWKRNGLHYLNQHIFRIVYFKCDKKWLYWTLRAVTKTIEDQAHGIIGMVHVTKGKLGGVKIPAIPLREQTQIARFLDHETARIDALIEEQQRLIELLKEKRQAVISHSVTKGLDPSAPMKDSGVEWLGAVPAHWDVVPTNYRYEIQLGRMLNEQRAQGDHLKPYLRVFDVQWNAINTTDLPLMDFPPEVQSMYRLKSGDLMVNEGGSYVGRSAIWRGDLDECYYQKALHRLRPRDLKRDTAEFFLHVMEMATQQGVFVAGGNQTTIDHLTAEQLRQYRFAFPPLEDQVHIAEKITAVVSKIQNTTSKAEELIGYLQERRSALISAAVTGKIDVRGWQPPTDAPSPELAKEAV